MSYGTSSYGESTYGSEASPPPLQESVSDSLSLETVATQEVAFSGNTNETINFENTVLDGEYIYFLIAQSMDFSNAMEFSQAYAAKAGFSLATSTVNNVVGTTLVAETMSLEDIGTVLYDAVAAEGVTFTDAQAYASAMSVVETLQVSGSVDTHLQAINLVAEAIVLLGDGGIVNFENVADTVQLTAAVLVNLMAYELHQVGITVGAEAVDTLSVYIEHNESLLLSDELTLAQQLTVMINEGINFSVGLRFGTDVYAAWLVNTATTGASRYDNFPFNSFSEGPVGYYGAADDGIYLMQGDTDDGEDIVASVKSGLYDFGERKSKRIHDVFLGVLTSGDLVLKVTADEQGTRTEAWYEVVHHGDADNHRAKVGKGLRGVYWGWELVNVDGADMDLNNVQMYPLTLSRRV